MTEPTTLSTLEEAPSTAPTERVSPPTPPPGAPRMSRWRWLVALIVVALVTAGTVAGTVLLTGAGGPSTAARWAPSDAVVYAELRADLPGDQRAALGELLSAFPGFADQANLQTKLDDLYGRLLAAATSGKQSWASDVKPWFGGQLGVAAGPIPTSATAAPPHVLAIATSTDPAAALAWVRSSASDAGTTLRTATEAGTTVLLAGTGDRVVAAAAPTGVLLVGDEASVRSAIDRGGTDGLATSARFKSAIASQPSDHLSLVYVDSGAVMDALASAADKLPANGPSFDAIRSLVPDWYAGTLRAESDALVAQGAAPKPSAAPTIADAASRLPSHLPANTIALAETHAVGDSVAAISKLDAAGVAADRLEAALKPVGGLDGLLGWVDEAGVAVLPGTTQPLAGVVATASDATAAQNLSRSLRNLATLGGLTPTDETHGGATITTLDVGSLLNGAGSMAGGRSVSWTVSDGLVVVSTDKAFVEAVLDTSAGGSLADQAAFRSAVDRAGSSHRALVWADLDAVEALVVTRMDATERARFEHDVQPYLAPFDAVVGVAMSDGSLVRSRGLVVLGSGR